MTRLRLFLQMPPNQTAVCDYLEKPRTAGLCGRAAGAYATAALYLVLLSNGQIRGETLRNGAWPGGKHPSQKARFPTVGAGCTGPFHTSPTNAATLVSRGCGGYTLAFANRIAHSGLHGETRGVLDGGRYHYPRSVLRGSETLRGRDVKTANFAAFGSWPGALPKNAESLRDSDALMRVAVPRRRGPAGLRDPIAVSLTALIGFTVLADRDYRVRKKAHFVFMRRAALPALPAPSAALLYALMH